MFIKSRTGLSLLSVVISMVGLGLTVLATMYLNSYTKKSTRRVDEWVALLHLRKFVHSELDCIASMDNAGTPCVEGQWLDLVDEDGSLLGSGATGGVELRPRVALRGQCIQDPAPSIRLEYSFKEDDAFNEWSALYDGIDFGCLTPSSPAPPPATCVVHDEQSQFTLAQAVAAMGLPANAILYPEGYTAAIACDKLGYHSVVSYENQKVDSSCHSKTGYFWRKDVQAYANTNGCNVNRQITTVTCSGRRDPRCVAPFPYPEEFRVDGPTGSAVAASNDPGMRFLLGGNQYLQAGNEVIYGSRTSGPPYADSKTAAQLCLLLGYTKATGIKTSRYSSPRDNAVFKFSTRFTYYPARGNNKKIDRMYCRDPISSNGSFY